MLSIDFDNFGVPKSFDQNLSSTSKTNTTPNKNYFDLSASSESLIRCESKNLEANYVCCCGILQPGFC